jgi:N-acetylmuramoyl-L-alanine amidase
MLKQQLLSQEKYEVKCPHTMTPKGICIHNTANDASAANEIAYMVSNTNEVSFHIAIDDVEAIQGIPFNRNTWHAGDGENGEGNRNYISIEICYSKSGGDRFINAEKRAAKEVAALLKQYGWGLDKIKKHQDFSEKYCPHRTLDMGWQRFLNMIKSEYDKVHVEEYINVKPSVGTFPIFKTDQIWQDYDRLVLLGCPISVKVLDNLRKNVYKVEDCKYGYIGYVYVEENNNYTFTNYQVYPEESLYRILADGVQVSDMCTTKWIPGIVEEQLKNNAKTIQINKCNNTSTSYQTYSESRSESKDPLYRILVDGVQVSDMCSPKWIPGIIEDQLKKDVNNIVITRCN